MTLLTRDTIIGLPDLERSIIHDHRYIDDTHIHSSFSWVLNTYAQLQQIVNVDERDLYKTAYIIDQGAVMTLVSVTPIRWDSTQGFAGEKGVTGDRGPKGPLGGGSATGQVGPIGDTGPKGPNSTEVGPKGPEGYKGPTGNQGPIGEVGEAIGNAVGPIGPQGYKGPVGLRGPTGIQGEPLNDGTETGPIGTVGPLGPLGKAGPMGLPADGIDEELFDVSGKWIGPPVADVEPTYIVSWVELEEISTSLEKRVQPMAVVNVSAGPTFPVYIPDARAPKDKSSFKVWGSQDITLLSGNRLPGKESHVYLDQMVSVESSKDVTAYFGAHASSGDELDARGFFQGQALMGVKVTAIAHGLATTANSLHLHMTTSTNVDFSISNGSSATNLDDNDIDVYSSMHSLRDSTIVIGVANPQRRAKYSQLFWHLSSSADLNANVTIKNSTADVVVSGCIYQASTNDSFLFVDSANSLYATLMASRKTLVLSSNESGDTYKSYWGYADSGAASKNNFTVEFDSKAGSITSRVGAMQGFDYAEYFENTNDDVYAAGTILTLDGDKVRPAYSNDEPILGTVTKTAGIVGNEASFCWNKRYMTDDFGGVLSKVVKSFLIKGDIWVHEAAYTKDMGEVLDTKSEEVLLENPDYDPDLAYLPRAERPTEYTLASLLGQVYTRVYEDINQGNHVSALGLTSKVETPLRVMRMSTPFNLEKGYGVAMCLLTPLS